MRTERARRRRAFSLIVFSALVVSPFAVSQEKRPLEPVSASLERILSDETIWGKDFDALLSILASANAAGEETLMVFPDRVVAGSKAKSLSEAAPMAERANAAMRAPQPALKPQYRRLLRPPAGRAAFRAEAALFPDDGSFRVVWSRPGAEFLRRNISIKIIQERFGPPDSVTKMVLQTGYERRPLVLTLHSFASGAIAFAESDWAPVAGMVDRVLLDVRKVSRALFAE